MQVNCVVQVYLPYLLPRGEGWEGVGFTAIQDDLELRIRPRDLNEELFPNTADQGLSAMRLELQRLSLPTASVGLTARDYALDRIEALITGEIDPNQLEPPQLEQRLLEPCVLVVNLFLQHLRVLTGARFLAPLGEHFRLEDRKRYYLFPRTLTFFNAETGQPIRVHGKSNAIMSPGTFHSPERGNVHIDNVIRAIQSGPPNLERSLLIDAEESLTTLRLREFILNLAMACEVASNQFLVRKGAQSDGQIADILRSVDSFAVKRFDSIPRHLGLPSLRIEDNDTFDLVEQLYRARNSVVHEASLEFTHNGNQVEVDVELATEMYLAAKNAISWLDGK